MATYAPATITIDALDRRLLHALGLDGRLPFRRIAEALGSSEQTIARRYRRLREAGVVRVIVIRDPRRYRENTFVRIRTTPGAAPAIGEALARRDDLSWVTVGAGASEVTCAQRADDLRARDDLLLERLPRATHVLDVSTKTLLHVFGDGPEAEWRALDDPLTEDEVAALGGGVRRPGGLAAGADEPLLTSDDDELLRLLGVDGRMTYAALAAETGRSEAAVARRVDALFAHGTLFTDVELALALLGFQTRATLWLTVAPADLERVGSEITVHPEVAFTAAVSGPMNLMVAVNCRDASDLYRYLTQRLGAIDAIRQLEVSVAGRHIKQAGTIMDGDRLPNPLADAAVRPPGGR